MNPSTELALHQYVADNLGGTYDRGYNDCATFAAGALDVLTDSDLKNRITGKWHDEATALSYIKEHGSIGAHWKREGCRKIPLVEMTTGDFPVMRETGGLAVAVCLGAKTAVNTPEEGVTVIPNSALRNIVEVWRWA